MPKSRRPRRGESAHLGSVLVARRRCLRQGYGAKQTPSLKADAAVSCQVASARLCSIQRPTSDLLSPRIMRILPLPFDRFGSGRCRRELNIAFPEHRPHDLPPRPIQSPSDLAIWREYTVLLVPSKFRASLLSSGQDPARFRSRAIHRAPPEDIEWSDQEATPLQAVPRVQFGHHQTETNRFPSRAKDSHLQSEQLRTPRLVQVLDCSSTSSAHIGRHRAPHLELRHGCTRRATRAHIDN